MNNELKKAVAVCIVAYNHENYIKQAIESALFQDTDFPVCLFIADDNSSDKTPDICRHYEQNYPDRIRFISQTQNVGTVRNTFTVFRTILNEADKYKYIAMLDGDDYWCDKDKLQKQVAFFDANPEYGLLHTQAASLNNKTGLTHYSPRKNIRTGYIFPASLEEPMANCTVMIRIELLKHLDMDAIEKQNLFSCDYITNVIISKVSSVGFIDEVTAVWRREIDSVSSSKKVEKALAYIDHEIRSGKYLSSLFPVEYPFTEEEQKRYIARRKMEIALSFENYALAKEAFHTAPIFNDRLIVKLYLKNSFFFFVFLKSKQLKKSITQYINRI